jgi:hypothetical protein
MNEYFFQLAVIFLLITVFLNGFSFAAITLLNPELPKPLNVLQSGNNPDANFQGKIASLVNQISGVNASADTWYYNLPFLGPIVFGATQFGSLFIDYMTAFGSLIVAAVTGFKIPLLIIAAQAISIVFTVLQFLSILYIIKELVFRR